jgi:hypothetical protein
VTIVRSSGSRLSNFAIANIVEKRTALDLRRSDYDVFPDDYFIAERRGRIRSVRRAALRSEALPDADAFRLEEFPSRLFASERFVRVFEDMRCTGLSFVEAQVVSGSKIATEH